MDRAEAIRKIEYGLEMETSEMTPFGQLTVVRTDALKVALAALREQESLAQATSEWVSVDERLPMGADGKSFAENVIAYLDNGEVKAQVCSGWLNGDKWYLLMGDMDYHTIWGLGAVTHWMPLPEPPKEGAERTCRTCCGNDMEHDEVDNPCWNCKGDHSEWMPKEGAEG